MKKLVAMAMVLSVLPAVCVAAQAKQAQESIEKTITINGENRKLMWHINKANIWGDKEHLKSVDFFCISPDKRFAYLLVAKGRAPISKEDIKEVRNNNYVFKPFYRFGTKGEERAIVILGTKDAQHALSINVALVQAARRGEDQFSI